jgi:hypothetical protein
MTMTFEERKAVTQKLFLVGISTFILGTLAVLVFRALFAAAGSGDTPIVIIGGSLTFKAGDKNVAWASDSATQYHVSPSYALAAIVVKAKSTPDSGDTPVGDDSSPKTDRLVVDLSGATSWEIDEYTKASGDSPVVAITSSPSSNNINLVLKDQNGFFCANKQMKRITYGVNQSCSDPNNTISFAKVSVSVNNQEIGILDCIDQNNNPGICRIVFRGSTN